MEWTTFGPLRSVVQISLFLGDFKGQARAFGAKVASDVNMISADYVSCLLITRALSGIQTRGIVFGL
jgi:hypothetical protein